MLKFYILRKIIFKIFHVCIYAICMYVYVHMNAYMYTYVYVYVYVYTNTYIYTCIYVFSSVQSLSCVRRFVTPWTVACQASLSITNSWRLLKLMSIESVMHSTISSSVIPFSSCLQSFPASGSFQMSQFFASGGQSIGVSATASLLPKNIQDWFPLG